MPFLSFIRSHLSFLVLAFSFERFNNFILLNSFSVICISLKQRKQYTVNLLHCRFSLHGSGGTDGET